MSLSTEFARPAFLYKSDTGERYPPKISKSVLNRTKSEAISNILKWRCVTGEKEPQAMSTNACLEASL
jgi:hypothetical protein